MDDEKTFPQTAEDFQELRNYLEFLKDELDRSNTESITEEELSDLNVILTNIEEALTLSELHINDHVLHVRDAKSELSRIFKKSIT